ncbi:MAG: fibro-slime domain-containing protein [Polyangiaceae bacterium]|nr:fibro-slime domain-containing protein [Polyangiaceae bacterium]
MRTATPLFTTVALLALSSALGACSATSTDPGSTSSPVTSGTSPETGGSSGVFKPSPASTGTVQIGAIDPNLGVGNVKTDCQPKLIGIVRDFNSKYSTVNPHPDFEQFVGPGITPGLVKSTLGANGAPEYADPQPPGDVQITSKASFDLWYSTAHPANAKVELDLDNPPASASITKSVDQVTGATTYESTSFFPIDGKGTQAQDVQWGENKDESKSDQEPKAILPPFHNYHFTFELNTKFIYKPGQVFSFFGDDDLWVFIDRKLAVDVGGLHPQAFGMVELDKLGLMPDKEYELSVFHAERRTTTSNFKATTNITFSNCDPIVR